MKFRTILFCNLFALIILGSDLLPWTHAYWQWLDDVIFWHANALIIPEHAGLVTLLSWASTRAFDALIFLSMWVLFIGCALSDRRRPHWLATWSACGLMMLFTAGAASLFIHTYVAYGHPSPTLVYDHAHLLSQLTSLPVKDQATNSFPGDHGLMAMIYASFMLYYAPRAGKVLSVLLAVLITLPRIMVGAHWFSDVYMGSLAFMLLISPWMLYRPLLAGVTRILQRVRP